MAQPKPIKPTVKQPQINTAEEAVDFSPWARDAVQPEYYPGVDRELGMSGNVPYLSPEDLELVQRNIASVTMPKPGDRSINPLELLNVAATGGISTPKSADGVKAARDFLSIGGQGMSEGGIPISAVDPEMQAINRDLIAESRGKINESERYLQYLRGKGADLDLSPLMALVDSEFGGNLQKGYNKPQSPEEMITLQQKLEDMVQKQREGLLTESSKQSYNRALQAQIDQLWKGSRQFSDQKNKLLAESKKTLNEGSQKFHQQISGINNLMKIVKTGSQQQIRQHLNLMLKLNGAVGTQTEGDIARQFEPTLHGLMNDVMSYLTGAENQRLPPHQQVRLLDSIQKQKEAQLQGRKAWIGEKQGQTVAQAKGISAWELLDQESGVDTDPVTGKQKPKIIRGPLTEMYEKALEGTKVRLGPLKQGERYYIQPNGKVGAVEPKNEAAALKAGAVPFDPPEEDYIVSTVENFKPKTGKEQYQKAKAKTPAPTSTPKPKKTSLNESDLEMLKAQYGLS